MDKEQPKKSKILSNIILALNLIIICLISYLVFLPVYPLLKYKFFYQDQTTKKNTAITNANYSEKITSTTVTNYKLNEEENKYKLEIPKIGVEVPLIISNSSEYGLYKGAWVDNRGSNPVRGGNIVVTAHRFKYLPPSNLTFYLIDKLEIGDMLRITWDNKIYNYKVKETKIVENDDLSILRQAENNILTLYSCHPIFSQDQKYVVIGEEID